MFKKTKSKVLVDYASEEDDMSWHYHHSYKEAKVKKIMSKKERKEKKMLSSKDDEHLLLSGVKAAERKMDSVTMTMRQISPAKKLEKMEGWEPPRLAIVSEIVPDEALIENGQNGESALSLPPDSLSVPLEIPSWGGQGFEEDSSRYANLTDSNDPAAAVRWTSRAKVKLAGISRMSRGIASESPWAGFK
uniref:Si:ch211-225h24.2 n=1 Tax=Poecilia formosa TaxID=48698 RepID=A0A096MEB3_POEFO